MKNKIFKIFVILLCFYFIFNYLLDNNTLIKIIINADYNKISFVIILSILLIFFYSNLIFVSLKKICNIKISKSRWYLIYFNSQFLNSIPFFGIIYRAVQLKKFDLSYDKFIGIYLMIKWLYVSITLFLFSIDSFFIFKGVSLFGLPISSIFFLSAFVVFFSPIILGKFVNFLMKLKNLKSNKFFIKLNKLLELFLNSIFNQSFIKIFFFFLLTVHILELLIITQLIESLQANIPFQKTFIIFIGEIIIEFVSILPQNIFISEIGLGLLTEKMNFDFELGFLIKIYFRFILFFSSVLMVIIYNIYFIMKQKKLKNV